MSDYKELIEDLRDDYKAWGDGRAQNFFEVTLRCKQAADAIEQLVNDRNASMDALKALHDNGVVVDGTPCDFCTYNPPSSLDGKPCTMCPACKRREGGSDGK